jgi:GR25 family glycosyltransferase involved in LPS biosynthesis
MLDVDHFFACKVCINLDRRPERWTSMQRKLEQAGIRTVERLSAVDGIRIEVPEAHRNLRPVDYACTMSHLAAVRQARERGAESVLILEDDAFFDPEFPARFAEYVAQLPDDWHMLFLGGYHFQPPMPVNSHIVRAVETLTTHAYAVRDSLYDEFIRLNEAPPRIVDRNNTVLQSRFQCYCFEPNLVGQEGGYSDIMESEMPEKPLHYSFPITGQW